MTNSHILMTCRKFKIPYKTITKSSVSAAGSKIVITCAVITKALVKKLLKTVTDDAVKKNLDVSSNRMELIKNLTKQIRSMK